MSKPSSHTRADRAVDQFLKMTKIAQQLGVTRQLIEDASFRGDRITLRGRDVANFGLCSYLGLGDDPRLIEAAIEAVSAYGNSYSSSTAYTAVPMYGDLRERFEQMFDASVVIAGSTTLAHLAALPVIIRSGDHVLLDGLAHASLVATMPSLQVNEVTVTQIGHNDLDRVADVAGSTKDRVWYVIDGLYSMHGDTAPAEDVAALLDANENLWVYCDDAHGLGWDGLHGRGQFLRRAGWHERLVMSFGLAKSFGTMGGVIATKDPEMVETIEFTGGPMIFGGPLPPPVLGASVASADIHLSDELPELQAELTTRIDLVNEYAGEIGLRLSARERTPLWYVEVGASMTTASVAAALLQEGFFVNGAVFPAVPRNKGGIRFTVTRYNGIEQIRALLSAIKDVVFRYSTEEDVIDLTLLEESEDAPSDAEKG